MRVLLLGGGAREHCLGAAIDRAGAELFVVSHNDNPGLRRLAGEGRFRKESENDPGAIVRLAQAWDVGLVVVGLEDPLAHRVPDALAMARIPTLGPRSGPARLETSKRFARDLMQRHGISGNIEYHLFTDPEAVARFILTSPNEYAIKPVGLTAGKGVRITGEHFDRQGAADYARQVIVEEIGGEPAVVLEERLRGEEFTLQCFVDGRNLLPMPLVQDYKRARAGDQGPNTGSMGSYSQADHLLPFVSPNDFAQALEIMERVVQACAAEGEPYRGVLYGQFMQTPDGVRVVEFNARFGDPEAINVVPLLEGDFVQLALRAAQGTLSGADARFASKATVCKYVTPSGYPEKPKKSRLTIEESAIDELGVHVYFAKVEEAPADPNVFLTTMSRSIALVAQADTVAEAERAVERALAHVHGDFHVRRDIGTQELIDLSHRRLSALAVT